MANETVLRTADKPMTLVDVPGCSLPIFLNEGESIVLHLTEYHRAYTLRDASGKDKIVLAAIPHLPRY